MIHNETLGILILTLAALPLIVDVFGDYLSGWRVRHGYHPTGSSDHGKPPRGGTGVVSGRCRHCGRER